jgi:uncharacterized membrane protein YjgN (DUF898 family)
MPKFSHKHFFWEHFMSGILQTGAARPLTYTGRKREVARLAFGIGLLNLVTLSFYRFWGTTRLRRYLWSRVSFDGHALEYLGRGSELFVGFLIAVAILIPIMIVFGILWTFIAAQGAVASVVMQVIVYVALFYLIYVALYRARRYRLTRTLWRGIRAGQTGSSLGYALRALGYVVLSIITLGLLVPIKNARLFRYRMNHTWFGSEPFRCDARGGKLFKRWLVAWLLFIPTIGLSWVWYKAAEERYLVGSTTFQNVRFSSTLTGGQIFRLYLIYFAITIGVSVVFVAILAGFVVALMGANAQQIMVNPMAAGAGPIIGLVVWYLLFFVVMFVLQTTFFLHRAIHVVCRNIHVEGEPDYARLSQSDRAVPSFGEGLADALGAGGV